MIEVRRVRPDEYAEAGRATASAWQPIASPDDPAWLAFRSRIADVAGRDAAATVYVAIDDGRIVGSVTLEMSDRITDGDNPTALAPDEAHVRVLAVTPEARRHRGRRTPHESLCFSCPH